MLSEIEAILDQFLGTSAKSALSKATNLKWPLQKSKTLALIDKLERMKTTCALALAESSISSIYSVLEQTKLSNQCLADIKAKQEKVLELTITSDQGMCIHSLSTLSCTSFPDLFWESRREEPRL